MAVRNIPAKHRSFHRVWGLPIMQNLIKWNIYVLSHIKITVYIRNSYACLMEPLLHQGWPEHSASIIHFTHWKILRFPTLTLRQGALKTNEKPLQMTGSPHTNIQRRPQYRVLRRLFPLAWMWNSQEALRNTWWMEREAGEGRVERGSFSRQNPTDLLIPPH